MPVKRLLNKNSNYVSLFGSLLCLMYPNFLLCLGASKGWIGPGPSGPLERPRAGVKINAHILLTWALYGDDFKFKLKLLYPREKNHLIHTEKETQVE
jgi:hypothetical protein